jgi:drug/metabolite transporter (DMT)-like permease
MAALWLETPAGAVTLNTEHDSPSSSQGSQRDPMKARVSDLTAIFFAVAGFTAWVLGDSCIKWIGQYGLPPEEVVACMGLFMALALAISAAVRRSLGNLRPRSLGRQSVRALLDMANNVCVVIALRHLSLTMFYILIFSSPLVIAVLSLVCLGEQITSRKLFALLVGFCGVVIAVAPWSHSWHLDPIGFAACLVCVACFSANMVWSRVLTRTEPPESLAFCSGVVTAAAGLALTSLHPRPLTPSLTLVLIVMGVFCAAGTLCFYVAVKHTSAGNVSQYHYTQLVTGSLISYLVWQDKPGLPVVAGGLLILGSGALVALAARNPQPAILIASPGDASS